MRQKQYAVAAVSVLCLAVGVWFWFIETEPMEPRYFVPFGIMSVVFLFPTLVGGAASLSRKQYSVIGGLIILPGLMTVLLLSLPSPPLFLQRALGVNLIADLFKNETAQASDFLTDLKAQGLTRSSVYRFNITPAQRSFEAQLSYTNLIDPTSPHVTILSPIDWQRATAFRIEDMSRAAFLVFEPVLSEYNRQQIFEQRNIPDLNFETYLISAWASTLGEAQGVKLVSETQLRVLKIVDAQAFEAAFQDLIPRHDWPEAFTQSNQARWWSVNELEAYLAQSGSAPINIAFDLNPAQPRATVHAVKTGFKGTMYDADIWITSDADESWTLFAHAVDQNGEILRNAQVNLVGHAGHEPARNIRRYTLIYPDLPPEAVSLAFGFFHPKDKDMEFLQAGIGQRDWDGRRVIVPLNKNSAPK